jgi:hypothetical protein
VAAELSPVPADELPTCSTAESAGNTPEAAGRVLGTAAEVVPQPEQIVETSNPALPAIEESPLPEPPLGVESTVEPTAETETEEQVETAPIIEPTAADVSAPGPVPSVDVVVSESPSEPQPPVGLVASISEPVDPIANALPAEVPEPVSPAAARRQRALERQRLQMEQVEPKRSWWRSHLPGIAAGFLVALSLTIYLGLKNRSKQVVATPDPEVPTLDIADGSATGATESPAEPAMLPDSPAAIAVEKPSGKSPLLLSAKPSIAPAGDRVTSASADTESNSAPSDDMPVPTSSPSASHIKNPYVEATGLNAPITPPAQDDSATAQPAIEYPTTEPAVYRPGGRVPKTARVPNYPRTSTPYLR